MKTPYKCTFTIFILSVIIIRVNEDYNNKNLVVSYMNSEEILRYWKDTSNRDYVTMTNLFNSKDYSWSLFIGHLVIEKLLKAIYIKNTDDINPPRIHDLLELAKRAKIETSERQEDILDLLSAFNISARYPDYKQSIYLKCTEDYTKQRISEIKEMREWLISIIEK